MRSEHTTKPRVLFYQIRCLNEWCSGPEIWKITKEKPEKPMNCPVCGRPALPNDEASVRAIIDHEGD